MCRAGQQNSGVSNLDKSGFVALVIILGYFGLEVYGVHTQRHLTEHTYINDRYTAAAHAVELCGTDREVDRQRIAHNIRVVRRRAAEQLAEENPDQSPEYVEALLVDRLTARTAEVDALFEAQGCEGKALWRLKKSYEQIARLRLN